LMPRMLNGIEALLGRNPLILVEEAPLYQAGMHGIGVFISL
jgi:hypothetical protein